MSHRKRPDLPFGRGTVFPSAEAQALFANRACRGCDLYGLPWLVNNASELYWEHVHPTHKARWGGCRRFGAHTVRDGSLPHKAAK